LRIRQPITAVTSILHRISGVLLALAVPIIVYLLGRSLTGPDDYRWVLGLWDKLFVRVSAVLLLWALAHHLFAGVRYLLLDLHLGTELQQARTSAWTVHLAGLAVLVVSALWVIL
jgi:succinate dehydrogenase / fumarate reductase cytochrome b subunit